MQIERTINIKWWADEIEELALDNEEKLKQHAIERVAEMTKEGYSSGQLVCHIEQQSKSVTMLGWWKYE